MDRVSASVVDNARGSLDSWPSNNHRRGQRFNNTFTSTSAIDSSDLMMIEEARNHSAGNEAIGHSAPSVPPVLDNVMQQIRIQLSSLAVRFPQFREAAVLMPKDIANEDELRKREERRRALWKQKRNDDEDMASAERQRAEYRPHSSTYDKSEPLDPFAIDNDPDDDDEQRAAQWWEIEDPAPPPSSSLLLPLESPSYISISATGEDVFAAQRLQVFRDAAKRVCTDFRTYRNLFKSIFIEYDRYIHFCNRFVYEEKAMLMKMKEELLNERRGLLVQIADLQHEVTTANERMAAAEATAAQRTVEAHMAKEALDASSAKVSLVDKIIADSEHDKGILARRLIIAEREANELKERLKLPEKTIETLRTQLDNKESFLKDISRRYERACNALDSLKKQLKEEIAEETRRDEERREKERQIQYRGQQAPAPWPKEAQLRVAVLMNRCAMLEGRLNTFNIPLATEDNLASTVETADNDVPLLPFDGNDAFGIDSPRSARQRTSGGPTPRTPKFIPAAVSEQPQSALVSNSNSSSANVTQPPASKPNTAEDSVRKDSNKSSKPPIVESTVFVAQLEEVPEDHRIEFCIDTVSTLSADLREVRAKYQELQTLLVCSKADVDDDMMLPHATLYPHEDPTMRFFVASNPLHENTLLRATGRVRNQKFSLASIKSHIHGFIADTVAFHQMEFTQRFLMWMRRKYTEDTATMSYCFFKALSWYPDDVDCCFFREILEGSRPEIFWKIPYAAVGRLRELFEKCSNKHGGAVLPRQDATRIISTEMVSWDLARLESLAALFVTDDVDWRKLFQSIGSHEAPFLQKFRMLWYAEYLDFFNDVSENLLEDPQLGSGTVTPTALVRALLRSDANFGEVNVLELVATLFGDTVVDEVQSIPKQSAVPLYDRFLLSNAERPAVEFFDHLKKLPQLLRRQRKQKRSGGLYGLRQAAQ